MNIEEKLKGLTQSSSGGLSSYGSKVGQYIQRIQFTKAQQADFLLALSSPMKVGRSTYDISIHISKYGEPAHKIIAKDILSELQVGNAKNPISKALEGWVDGVSLSALAAAERSGPATLVYAIESIAASLQQSSQSYITLFAMSAYPLLLNIFAVLIMFYSTAPTVEMYRDLIGGAYDPVLDGFENVIFFYKYIFWALFVGLIAFMYFTMKYMKNSTSDIRLQLDQYPIFKLYRLNTGSKIIATYSLLRRFGMSPMKILEIIKSAGGNYQRFHSQLMMNSMQEGRASTETTALDTGLLDRKYISLLYLYVGGNKEMFVDAMDDASKAIDKEIAKQMKAFSRLITVLLFILLLFNISQLALVQYGFDIRNHL